MKMIMFNDDPYGLTDAVLAGIKTQTRRIVPKSHLQAYQKYVEDAKVGLFPLSDYLLRRGYAKYIKGEIVAIAQSYKSIGLSPSFVHTETDHDKKNLYNTPVKEQAGWNNKMYVAADFMPHHIRITGVRVEKVQSITDDDIVAEGVRPFESYRTYTTNPNNREATIKALRLWTAYGHLFDALVKKKIFRRNPYVYVYEFELID